MEGIDVSYWQFAVDWEQVSRSFDFAYIRAGIGSSGKDSRCLKFTSDALNTAMLIGHYHLFKPDQDGIKQAENAIRVSNGFRLRLVPAIDFELLGDKVETATQLLHMCLRLEQEYCAKPVIYTNKGVWSTNLLFDGFDDYFKDCNLWVANYDVTRPNLPRCWKSYAVWQYSSSVRVKGVSSLRCDTNHSGPQFDQIRLN